CLFAAHQTDGLFQLAIPERAKPGDFQPGVLDLVGFFAVSGVKAQQQETGDEECYQAPGDRPIRSRTRNIQQPTSNTQHRTQFEAAPHWALDVRCSGLDVLLPFGSGCAGTSEVRGEFKGGFVFHLAMLTDREAAARTSRPENVLPASRRQEGVLCRQGAGSTLRF